MQTTWSFRRTHYDTHNHSGVPKNNTGETEIQSSAPCHSLQNRFRVDHSAKKDQSFSFLQ